MGIYNHHAMILPEAKMKSSLDISAQNLLLKSPEIVIMQKKSPEALTWQLLFVVFSASLGAWFPIGYSYGVTNPIQTLVLNWVRSVKCGRLGGSADQVS